MNNTIKIKDATQTMKNVFADMDKDFTIWEYRHEILALLEAGDLVCCQESKATELINKFNVFIKKWCGNMYPHLIDSDENDGEAFRQAIKDTFNHPTQK